MRLPGDYLGIGVAAPPRPPSGVAPPFTLHLTAVITRYHTYNTVILPAAAPAGRPSCAMEIRKRGRYGGLVVGCGVLAKSDEQQTDLSDEALN